MPSHFPSLPKRYILPFLLISKTSQSRANMERVLLLLICLLLLSQPNNCSSSLSFNSSTPLCHSHQSSALLHFRNSFSVGDSLYRCDYYSYPPKNSWKMGTDCCGWDGVTCDTMTGHVIGLDLSCSRLEGPIHSNSTLFSLRHLQWLNLAYNYFNSSAISSKFGGFANMTHLNLTESSVAGNVPSEISHLSKLVSLDLSWNFGMRIETPNLKRLVQNLTHLTELFLTEVNMSSVSPNSFMNLSSSLTSLSLFYCGLKGRFPDNIFHLPNLQLLELGYNYNLTGSLPTYNWSTPLKSLDLSSTEFPIDLPNLISNLKSLKELYLSGCNFIDSSNPTFLSNLTQITSLDLSYNNFGGQCPWYLLNNAGLTSLGLSGNNFIGQVPDFSTHWTQVSSSNSSSNSQSTIQIPSNW
ncbi:receptor-like protein Cf-9 [Quercus robur]|uniref:receptor-like protein Cf-9 n=1 Tax=Quercus robur TaxID=38942 RepID=UPI002161E313|nr:receptor-like protein Cf-9 [Quercus robur]